MQASEMPHKSDPTTSQPVQTVMAEHVTHEISISSHVEAGLVLCCCLVALVAFAGSRLRGSLLVSTGFLLVLGKYAIGYFTYPSIQIPMRFVFASMALGSIGLALVAIGLHLQYTEMSQRHHSAHDNAE